MKFNSAIVISLLVSAIGFFFGQTHLWIPLSVLMAGVIDLFTRQWIISDKLGRAVIFSTLLKFVLALVGFYAMLGQIACLALIFYWIF